MGGVGRYRLHFASVAFAAILAVVGYLVNSSTWTPILWAVAIVVVLNPLVRLTLAKLGRFTKRKDSEKSVPSSEDDGGRYQVTFNGPRTASAINVVAEALGISGSESITLLHNPPVVVATDLTVGDAKELVRKLRQAKAEAQYLPTP